MAKSVLLGLCSSILIGAAIWLGWTATHPTQADRTPPSGSQTSSTVPTGTATPPATPSHSPERGAVVHGVPLEPTGHATDRFVNQPYSAPTNSVSTPGAGGHLLIPSLRISAPIDVVQLDNGVMTIPNLTSQVGWLQGTAAFGDVTGASVIAGHVADDSDIPGALYKLKDLRAGAKIIWISPKGTRAVFVMVTAASYPRGTSGLPASIFRTDGPHVLNLITCFDKQTYGNGGFHYLRNLVVTARAIS